MRESSFLRGISARKSEKTTEEKKDNHDCFCNSIENYTLKNRESKTNKWFLEPSICKVLQASRIVKLNW